MFLQLNTGVKYIYIYMYIYVYIYIFVRTYTNVQFEQLHKYMQKRNKIYKTWYTHKQSVDIKLFGISRTQNDNNNNKKKQKGDVNSKSIDSFIIVVVMICRD